MLDPNDFIITRKRKKYKFAQFANSPLCFEFDEWRKQPVDIVEIGAGNGLFSVELAERYPERQFVALDVKGDRLQKGAYEAAARGLTNVQFIRARADQVLELFTSASLMAIWVTFPDPFPRERSAGRRLTHPTFLARYGELLCPEGALHLKHDNRDFFHWSLEQFVQKGWYIDELSFDLHESDLSDEYKIQTTYERRWLSEGLVTNFARVRKR
ncbi:tRNA (guanosine(46)-N7)-methyltransferase TrmB [Candidatus Saccharibacteria bacterium]|nr:tRNA (guanosine(46)-N7)-methyltransferase TrmB [Candidatus Saccharibacteria bacterium]